MLQESCGPISCSCGCCSYFFMHARLCGHPSSSTSQIRLPYGGTSSICGCSGGRSSISGSSADGTRHSSSTSRSGQYFGSNSKNNKGTRNCCRSSRSSSIPANTSSTSSSSNSVLYNSSGSRPHRSSSSNSSLRTNREMLNRSSTSCSSSTLCNSSTRSRDTGSPNTRSQSCSNSSSRSNFFLMLPLHYLSVCCSSSASLSSPTAVPCEVSEAYAAGAEAVTRTREEKLQQRKGIPMLQGNRSSLRRFSFIFFFFILSNQTEGGCAAPSSWRCCSSTTRLLQIPQTRRMQLPLPNGSALLRQQQQRGQACHKKQQQQRAWQRRQQQSGRILLLHLQQHDRPSAGRGTSDMPRHLLKRNCHGCVLLLLLQQQHRRVLASGHGGALTGGRPGGTATAMHGAAAGPAATATAAAVATEAPQAAAAAALEAAGVLAAAASSLSFSYVSSREQAAAAAPGIPHISAYRSCCSPGEAIARRLLRPVAVLTLQQHALLPAKTRLLLQQELRQPQQHRRQRRRQQLQLQQQKQVSQKIESVDRGGYVCMQQKLHALWQKPLLLQQQTTKRQTSVLIEEELLFPSSDKELLLQQQITAEGQQRVVFLPWLLPESWLTGQQVDPRAATRCCTRGTACGASAAFLLMKSPSSCSRGLAGAVTGAEMDAAAAAPCKAATAAASSEHLRAAAGAGAAAGAAARVLGGAAAAAARRHDTTQTAAATRGRPTAAADMLAATGEASVPLPSSAAVAATAARVAAGGAQRCFGSDVWASTSLGTGRIAAAAAAATDEGRRLLPSRMRDQRAAGTALHMVKKYVGLRAPDDPRDYLFDIRWSDQKPTIELLARKVDMTACFAPDGRAEPVTLLQVLPATIIYFLEYGKAVVSYSYPKRRRLFVGRPLLGKLQKVGATGFEAATVTVRPPAEYILGQILDVSLLLPAKHVHVRAVKKAKGFQGVVARYGFNRGPQSHGSKHHRGPGSIGAGTDPGRVFPGTRMAGRDKSKMATVRNLRVLGVNAKQNLLVVRGSVPGWDMRTVVRVIWERWREEEMEDHVKLLQKGREDRLRLIGGEGARTASATLGKNPAGGTARATKPRGGTGAAAGGGRSKK